MSNLSRINIFHVPENHYGFKLVIKTPEKGVKYFHIKFEVL